MVLANEQANPASVITTGTVDTLLGTDVTGINAQASGAFGAFFSVYPQAMAEVFSATPDASVIGTPTNTTIEFGLPTAGGDLFLTGTGFTIGHGSLSEIQYSGPFLIFDMKGSGTWTPTSFSTFNANSLHIADPFGDALIKGHFSIDATGNLTSSNITGEIISAGGVTVDIEGPLGNGLGHANSITVSDGSGDAIRMEGSFSPFDFGQALSTSTTVLDLVDNQSLLAGSNHIAIAAAGIAVHGWDGNDQITGTAGSDTLFGDNGYDILVGGAGNDTLDGGAGNDLMQGGLGDDTYFVDNTNDTVVERPGEGHDTVFASASYHLAANVEDLTLTGSGNINGYGNSGINVITGNSGNNLLDSGANAHNVLGADMMIGGAGDDTYVSHSFADVIVENAGQGSDTVVIDYSAAHGSTMIVDLALNPQLANVENATIQGSGLFNINGSADNNHLVGNASVNVIDGAGGSDFLDGGFGHDTLTGGAGSDVFHYTLAEVHQATNADIITDFTAGVGGDAIDLSDVLHGFIPGTSAVSDFVHATTVGSNTVLSVDADGHAHGAHFVQFATLQGVTGVDVNQLYTDGNLLLAHVV